MYYANLKYYQGAVVINKAQYSNGRIALQINSTDGKPVAVASSNVPNAECPEGCTFIKDYSENVGVKNFLITNKIIAPEVVAIARSGFVTMTAHKVLI